MNKLCLPLFIFLAAACSDKGLYDDAVKTFERHSYLEYAAGEVRGRLEAGGFSALSSLDAHAALMNSRRRVRQRQGKAALSAGLLVGYRGGAVCVLKVFKNSPAAAAGFKDGDKITEIDGLPASPLNVAGHMNGSFGFSLKATRRAPGGGQVASKVKREEFYFPLVFGFYEPDPEVAYIKIGMLAQGASAAVKSGLEAMTGLGAKKVVIDLRDNGGGMPDEAAGLLEAFAPKAGPVLEIKSRHKGYSRLFEARGRGRFAGLKAVVLVDSGTAMAAEVFARSLKELAGAQIVGGNSKGDVSLLRTFRLGRGHKGLELTVARMFPPSGLDLEGKGVEPDHRVDLTVAQAQDQREAWGASSETSLLADQPYAKAIKILTSKRSQAPF